MVSSRSLLFALLLHISSSAAQRRDVPSFVGFSVPPFGRTASYNANPPVSPFFAVTFANELPVTVSQFINITLATPSPAGITLTSLFRDSDGLPGQDCDTTFANYPLFPRILPSNLNGMSSE